MTNNTINNVPRELLKTLLAGHLAIGHKAAKQELRALLSAPSPASVDGLEVVALWYADDDLGRAVDYVKIADGEGLCRLSDVQAIIDGLRGEVARYKTMSDNYCAIGMDANQRIGELEGFLRSCLPALSDGGCAALANRIDAALAAVCAAAPNIATTSEHSGS